MRALDNRPDLRATQLGITAAKSQHELAKANGRPDITVSGNYSHVNAISAFTFFVGIPLPIFDRNQGNIAQNARRHKPKRKNSRPPREGRCSLT
jgi:cobalt-zinc-cadmium efflux system outer membrane protein